MNFLEARKVDGLGEKCRFRHVSQDLYSHQRLLHGVQADPKKTKFPVYWPGEIFFTLLHFFSIFHISSFSTIVRKHKEYNFLLPFDGLVTPQMEQIVRMSAVYL